MSSIFGSDASLLNVLKILKDKDHHSVRTLILFDPPSEELTDLAAQTNVEILSLTTEMSKLIEEGYEEMKDLSGDTENIFTISYTSGTSGNPKGVMLTNGNFMSGIANILQIANYFKLGPNDVYISYLPLAHVFDRLGCHAVISVGGQIGFFGGKILEITKDLILLKPTIFPSVPRLLNKVYDKVMAGVSEVNVIRRFLFYQGLVSKDHYNKKYGWTNNSFFDSLVFSRVKERLGGRVRVMITASAPIAPKVLAMLRCVFCCPIVEAYGQTESCGASFGTKIFETQAGHVGGPGIGVEYKLKDLKELQYTRDSKPYPAGEVCLRGPSIFKGYFKNKKLTDETKDSEGWIHTGDVGQIMPDKRLIIIDRVKNIFKLS